MARRPARADGQRGCGSLAVKTTGKEQHNPNIADAIYSGGHSQTAIALAVGNIRLDS